jgi:glutamyl-tRNA reductase
MSAVILVIGLNHSTAPVEIREKITFPGDDQGAVTRGLLQTEGVQEAMILSTCNRAELIVTTEDPEQTSERLVIEIGRVHGLDMELFRKFLYFKQGPEGIRHLFRVASSLDSMVLGEPQILGQVKEGYRRATQAQATGPVMNRLMHRAFFAAKRVRSETGIGSAAVSVAYVAVELARKILGELKDKRVLLLGAGEMAELAARHVMNQVDAPLVVVNRTFENACLLARQLQGSALPLDHLEEGLAAADVVITSTGSCDPVICAADMQSVMRKRRFRPIFIIDIAIPRDVEPEVNDIDGIYLYNIDDLQTVVDENIGGRRQEACKADVIVNEEVDKFVQWTKTLDTTPVIVALRERLETIRQGELVRQNGKLSTLTPAQRETVEAITRSIINKIAHDPIAFLKKAGLTSKRNDYFYAAQRMFRLDDRSEDDDFGEES